MLLRVQAIVIELVMILVLALNHPQEAFRLALIDRRSVRRYIELAPRFLRRHESHIVLDEVEFVSEHVQS